MNTNDLWKHTWPCSDVLSEFIATNSNLWKGKVTLELGAGASALPSLCATMCGASRVVVTDQKRLEQAFAFMRANFEKNLPDEKSRARISIMALDWGDEESLAEVARRLPRLDYIFGSDVFFDPVAFPPLIATIRKLLNVHPNAEFYFSYQLRDSDWTIEDLLLLNHLVCTPIRLVDTGEHSFFLGKIHRSNLPHVTGGMKIHAGVEGGATKSTLVLVSHDGEKLGEWQGPPLNCLLSGIERSSDQIAEWVRTAMAECRNGTLHPPVASLGMGLSGAESEETNEKMLEYLRRQHADLAKSFFLTSDSIISAAAAFGGKGGVVIIAGTGSTCRLLKADGSVHGVGGWGHLINDDASAIPPNNHNLRAVRKIFDTDDGLAAEEAGFQQVKEALYAFFHVRDKTSLLDLFYGAKFDKPLIASFTTKIAELAAEGNAFCAKIFCEAGECIAQFLLAISRHFDKEMLKDVPILLVGSVFKSWRLMRKGFENYLRSHLSAIVQVSLHELKHTPALGAAYLGVKDSLKDGEALPQWSVIDGSGRILIDRTTI